MRPADRCPGVLRPHFAEDGAVVRLRVPGGRTTTAGLAALSQLAEEYGNPDLQLTSRAGIQLRGLPPVLPAPLVDGVIAAGFLPSASHERVRNIAASPLTGIWGGLADVAPLVGALDEALRAEPALAELPGRFLFVLDDGRGDVSASNFDLCYRALDADFGVLLVGDRASAVAAQDVVRRLVLLALAFLEARGTTGAWHVRELPDWVAGLPGWAASLPDRASSLPSSAAGEPGRAGSLPDSTAGVPGVPAARLPSPSAAAGVPQVTCDPVPYVMPFGVVGGAASVHAPLGLLRPEQVVALADVPGPVVITPWRGLVLPEAGPRLDQLTTVGFVADPESTWPLVSACVGAPRCGKALGDTWNLAHRLVKDDRARARTHVSGCERRCGAPAGAHVDLMSGSLR